VEGSWEDGEIGRLTLGARLFASFLDPITAQQNRGEALMMKKKK
jgi:hypothetical protein